MSYQAFVVLLLCLVCEVSFADTLVMKSGENKKGKILEETEKSILFNSQADGVVVEVPRYNIAIIDKDLPEGKVPAKGSLQVFSAIPRKKADEASSENPLKDKRPLEILLGKDLPSSPQKKKSDQAASFQSFTKLIEEWIRSNPEAEKYIQEWMTKFKIREEELDKVIKVAQET